MIGCLSLGNVCPLRSLGTDRIKQNRYAKCWKDQDLRFSARKGMSSRKRMNRIWVNALGDNQIHQFVNGEYE